LEVHSNGAALLSALPDSTVLLKGAASKGLFGSKQGTVKIYIDNLDW